MNKHDTRCLKGATILFMVYHHLFAYADTSLYTSIFPLLGGYRVEQIVGLFGKICVTAYLFLSGYGIAFKVNEQYTLKNSLSRVWNLYKCVWLVFVIFVPFEFLIKGIPFHLSEFVLNIVGYNCTYNKEWWFLFTYTILMLLLPAIKHTNLKHLMIGSIGVIMLGYISRWGLNKLAFYSVIDSFLHTNFWTVLYNLVLCQFAFFSGYMFQKLRMFEKTKRYVDEIPKMVIVFIFVIIIFAKLVIHGGYAFDTVLTPIYFVCILKLVGNNRFLNQFFSLFGTYSTIIWLTHTFYFKYLFREQFYSLKYSLLIFVAVVGVSLLGAITINHIQIFLGQKIAKIKQKRNTVEL